MHMRLLPVTLVFVLTMAVGGCGEDEGDAGRQRASAATAPASEFPMTVTSCGDEITVDAPPERLVTTGGYAVNLVAAAGGLDRIVARYGEFGAPLRDEAKAIEDVPILAEGHEVSAERLIATTPDLVVSGRQDDTPKALLDKLASAGIPVLSVEGYCTKPGAATDGFRFEDISGDIRTLGRILGTAEPAAESAETLQTRLSEVGGKASAAAGRRGVAVQIFEGVIYVFGPGSTEHAQLEAVGIENVFDENKEAFEASSEELIDRDPEVVVIQYGFDEGNGRLKSYAEARDEFLAVPGMTDIAAARDGAVTGVHVDQTQPDPRAVDGIETISEQLTETGAG